MLHATPESAYDHQPLVDKTAQIVLTADARIDNRTDLIKALGWDRTVGRSASYAAVSDGALIVEAYKKWGVACVEHLLGAFAFALWDGRARRLVCARDPMGVKPLYYAYNNKALFTCASEIRALLAQPDVANKINERWVAHYLGRLMYDKETTAYAAIRRLPAGHVLTVSSSSGLEVRRYWSLEDAPDQVMASEAEYVEEFAERFRAAVRCRLRAPGPIGVELSGGLDSSSVACVARDLLKEQGRLPLRSYSGIFPGYGRDEREKIDERAYIQAVVETGGIESTCVPLSEQSPFAGADQALRHAGQPLFTFNAYLMRNLMQAASADGVRVVLDGIEGDIAVSHGDGYLVELAYQGRWDRFLDEAGALAERQGFPMQALVQAYGMSVWPEQIRHGAWSGFLRGVRRLSVHTELSSPRLVWQHGIKPLLPASIRQGWNALRGAPEQAGRLERLLSPDLRARTDFVERKKAFEAATESITTERDAHIYTLTNGVATQFLEEGDHLAAAHGIERRHPFYDVRLLEYCVGLPPEYKMRNGWTRYILREGLGDTLPPRIQRRTSKGRLRANFVRNLLEKESNAIDRLLDGKDAERIAPYIDISVLRKARDRADAELLWSGLQLAAWLRNRDGEPANEIG
jgi:asparagine synthase (glutamine-hydrolysing)